MLSKTQQDKKTKLMDKEGKIKTIHKYFLYILGTGPVTVLSPLTKNSETIFLYKQTPKTKNTNKIKVNK